MKTLISSFILIFVFYSDYSMSQIYQPFKAINTDNHIICVQFSPDGKTIACGERDGTIQIWDVQSGLKIKELTGHSKSVNSIVYNENGELLASASTDKTVKIWNVEGGKELYTLSGHTDNVTSVSFSPDGKTLASGSFDKTIIIWDISTGKSLFALGKTQQKINAIAYSPNGNQIISGEGNDIVKPGGLSLWDIQTHNIIKTFKSEIEFVQILSVDFDPSGEYFASCGFDHNLYVWDINSGRNIRTFTLPSVGETVKFYTDPNTLICSTLKGLYICSIKHYFEPITSKNSLVRGLTISPDGQYIAMGTDSQNISFWDINTIPELSTLPNVNVISEQQNPETIKSSNQSGNQTIESNVSSMQSKSPDKNQQILIPNYFGVFAVSNNKLIEFKDVDARNVVMKGNLLAPIMGLPTANDGCYFSDPSTYFIVYGEKMNPMHGPTPVLSKLIWKSDLEMFVAGASIKLRVGPVQGLNDAYKLMPEYNLLEGLYCFHSGRLNSNDPFDGTVEGNQKNDIWIFRISKEYMGIGRLSDVDISKGEYTSPTTYGLFLIDDLKYINIPVCKENVIKNFIANGIEKKGLNNLSGITCDSSLTLRWMVSYCENDLRNRIVNVSLKIIYNTYKDFIPEKMILSKLIMTNQDLRSLKEISKGEPERRADLYIEEKTIPFTVSVCGIDPRLSRIILRTPLPPGDYALHNGILTNGKRTFGTTNIVYQFSIK